MSVDRQQELSNASEEVSSAVRSLLSKAIDGTEDWREIARVIADEMQNPKFDWRDLTKSVDHLRSNAADSDINATSILDCIEMYAMRLSERHNAERFERASADLLMACAHSSTPKQMIARVIEAIRTVLPFETATYLEYDHDPDGGHGPTLVRSHYAIDGPDEFRWPARWMAIPRDVVAWVEGEKLWIRDVSDFHASIRGGADIEQSVVSREYARRGVTSFVLARRMDGGRVSAALTFGRKTAHGSDPFGPADQAVLGRLRLDPVFRRIGDALIRERAAVARNISALFTADANAGDVAKTLVQELGEGFAWEYVALFRVNHRIEKFELVSEYDRDGDRSLTTDYKQDITRGMLGHALRMREPIYAPDLTVTPTPFDYLHIRGNQASAICFPILLRTTNASVEWILNVESKQLDAFPRPDRAALETIISNIKQTIDLWADARLSDVLLEMVEQGVVVLGEHTDIHKTNAAARRLLGLSHRPEHDGNVRYKFLDFAADDSSRSAIESQDTTSRTHLRLLGADGIVRGALGRASCRDEAFHRRVWLLADLTSPEWIGALSYMEAAVRNIAAQTRSKLLLAAALIRKTESHVRDTMVIPDLRHASKLLSSADITFERISANFDALSEASKLDGVFHIAREAKQFLSRLPYDEQRWARIQIFENATIKGDPEHLGFVLRTLFSYVLHIRAPNSFATMTGFKNGPHINVYFRAAKIVSTSLAPSSHDISPVDYLSTIESQAYEAAATGMDSCRKVLAAHGATLSWKAHPSQGVKIKISGLARADQEAAHALQ